MAIAPCAALLAAFLASGSERHPLAELADKAAEAIAAVAAGRPVEVVLPDDRSGLGAAYDLHGLLAARLRDRTRIADRGARLRLASVLGRSATRIRLVGRLTEEPEGSLVDLIAVSAEVDADLVPFLAGRFTSLVGGVSVGSGRETAPLPRRVLDLAFVGADRVLVLMEGALALYRLDAASGFVRLGESALPVTARVRAPAGMLVAWPEEKAAWLATNQAEGAILFSVDGDHLAEVERAAALRWMGAPQGISFRAGTNLIEAPVRGLSGGPYLRVGDAPQPWAVAKDGRLGIAGAGWTETRVGSAVAALWPGAFLASSAGAPGAHDLLSVVTVGAEGSVGVTAVRPVTGAVRAVAALPSGKRAAVVAAIEERGAVRLMSMEVALAPTR